MDTHTPDARRVELCQLLARRSVRLGGPFKLVSGRVSDLYVDTKPTTTSARGMRLVGELLYELIEDSGWGPDAVCGLTLGADPILGAISYTSELRGQPIDHLIVRKEPKGHGTQRWLEGWLEGVARVVVVDDVWTTGGSTLKAIEAAQSAGLEVVGAVALVDREEGAAEALRKLDPRALFKREELVAERRRLDEAGTGS